MRRILFVSSGGGHWVQLTRIIKELKLGEHEFYIASTVDGINFLGKDVKKLPDFNKSKPLKTLIGSIIILQYIFNIRPALAISTGAAPGLLCLLFTRLLGGKTIWIDSIANTEKLSLSGNIARMFSNQVLTQWEHLGNGEKVSYHGRVI
ncbi:hypothetical protein PYR66_08015 [Klebsiella aerogenes]|nr:hypothetical protein PYR66_08015 [Klebsiella aerogenes]